MTPRRPRHRAEPNQGMAEATEALVKADSDLQATRARWPVVRALTGKAAVVSDEAHHEQVVNHLGDLFLDLLREG
ncbi:hypothetical protein [Pseudactinotalea sp. Z1748]|uniref:hypothetical protein n=1 Tax=Pseudactinotalea sp. Z1748 TaxID=3413027 RepID=UPI003C79885E